MTGKKEKICEIKDPELIRAHLVKGGSKVTCAKCCETSNDPEELCEPVFKRDSNVFCDGFSV
jgi:hypothetical protein